jgi:hypothetical protein
MRAWVSHRRKSFTYCAVESIIAEMLSVILCQMNTAFANIHNLAIASGWSSGEDAQLPAFTSVAFPLL